MNPKNYMVSKNPSPRSIAVEGGPAPQAEKALSEAQLLICREVGRGKKVLELGCGDGDLLLRLQGQCNETIGVEFNARSVARARNRGLRVKDFDLNEGVPFEDGSFDCIAASDVIDGIFDTLSLFEEARRVLKERGFFIFSVPNLNALGNRVQVAAGGYLGSSGGFPEDHDGLRLRVFNLPKLGELCRFSGFHIQKVWGLRGERKAPIQPLYRSLFQSAARPVFHWLPSLADVLVVRAGRVY